MSGTARVTKELTECQKDREVSGVFAESVDGSLTHIKGNRSKRYLLLLLLLLMGILGTIRGPTDTSYEGGVFHIDIV